MEGMSLARLQEVIEASHLSAADKGFWLQVMEGLDDDTASAILDSLPQDDTAGEELEAMTLSIKRKRDAIAGGDAMAFAGIVDEEVNHIRDL